VILARWGELVATPRDNWEAAGLIVYSRHRASDDIQPLSGEHHPLILFLEVCRVTLTHFTIALGVTSRPEGLRIHRLMPRRLSRPSRSRS